MFYYAPAAGILRLSVDSSKCFLYNSKDAREENSINISLSFTLYNGLYSIVCLDHLTVYPFHCLCIISCLLLSIYFTIGLYSTAEVLCSHR